MEEKEKDINWCGKILNLLTSNIIYPTYFPTEDTYKLKNAMSRYKCNMEEVSFLDEEPNKQKASLDEDSNDYWIAKIYGETDEEIMEVEDSEMAKIADKLNPLLYSYFISGMPLEKGENEPFENMQRFFVDSNTGSKFPVKRDPEAYPSFSILLKLKDSKTNYSFSLSISPEDTSICRVFKYSLGSKPMYNVLHVDQATLSLAMEDYLVKNLGMDFVDMRRGVYRKAISELKNKNYKYKIADENCQKGFISEDTRKFIKLWYKDDVENYSDKINYLYSLINRLENVATMELGDNYYEQERVRGKRSNKRRK